MFKLEAQPEVLMEQMTEIEANKFARAVKASPLKYFCPNGKQEEYINTVAHSTEHTEIPVILFTAANGIGKTTVSLHLILNIILGPQNGWFDYEIFHNWPFPKLIWYISTPTALMETVEPEFRRLLENRSAEFNKHGKNVLDEIQVNGFKIKAKTFNQDIGEFESANVGVINGDEPMPHPIWNAVKSRRRMGSLSLLPLTPLYTPPYLYDEVKKAADQDIPGYYHIEADVYTACKQRGVRGHLDAKIIDDMVKGYDPEERDARAYGKPAYFSGKIYSTLNRNIHCVDPATYPIPKNSIIKQIVDPHDGRPCACIYAAITPDGRIIIFDETPIDKSRQFWEMKVGFTVEQEIKSWIGLENRYETTIRTCTTVSRVMDRHFGWQTRGKSNFAELFYDEGKLQGREFNFQKSYEANTYQGGEVHYGHVQVNKALLPLADGKPGLVVWNTCYHVWEGLTHYIRKHETTKRAEDKPAQSGKIVEKYKDMADCVRILVCDTELPRIPADEKTRYERELEKVMSKETPIDERGFELEQSEDEYLSEFFEGEL